MRLFFGAGVGGCDVGGLPHCGSQRWCGGLGCSPGSRASTTSTCGCRHLGCGGSSPRPRQPSRRSSAAQARSRRACRHCHMAGGAAGSPRVRPPAPAACRGMWASWTCASARAAAATPSNVSLAEGSVRWDETHSMTHVVQLHRSATVRWCHTGAAGRHSAQKQAQPATDASATAQRCAQGIPGQLGCAAHASSTSCHRTPQKACQGSCGQSPAPVAAHHVY